MQEPSVVTPCLDPSPEVTARLSRIRFLLMDVDGVLTDGLIRIDDNGVEAKAFSTRDGFALVWVRKYGLKTGVLSGRKSSATEQRCRDLHFDEIYLGRLKKEKVFDELLTKTRLREEEIAYIGDDLIDLPVMARAGVSAAPCDAHPDVLKRVDVVLPKAGGTGAVRHFVDLWLRATGQWEKAIEDIYRGNL